MKLPLTPIRCLYRAVDLYANKIGVVSGADRYTYAQFGERCERLAGGLHAEGVQRGDRVAFLSFNNNQLLEGYYGPPLIRAIAMPLNVRLQPPELTAILNHADARALAFENDFAAQVEQLRATCPSVQRWISIDGPSPLADLTFDELLSRRRIDRPEIRSFDEEEIAELFYTSGSTGTPKGVMLSHRTLYLHALAVGGTFNHDDAAVELHTIPLFHANGWGRPQTAVMGGIKQVMVRRFDPAHVLRLIQDEGATAMSLVPTMANALLNSPALGTFDTSTMQEIHIGGAAAAPELIAQMEAAFRCRVMAGYGLTETCPVATSARNKCTVQYADEHDRIRHLAMAGWTLPGCEIRVVDLHMQDVPRDMETVGEVVIRGDNVMDGYFKEMEATAAVMSGDWFHTGDMAVWDRENYIHIVDRKKDIIVSGGENISSIEVEKAICAHPAVLECAVVAAPDPKWGEVPVAVVVLKSCQQLDAETLCAFLQGRLAGFKMPRLVEFTAQPLPKTGTGKILKRQLRENYWQGKTVRVGQA
ncbi:MAG TPA: long-chain-fatty-acid--CoA ligase [Bryobacteraceae bacterium]|nr:long-chain-fatty-acid--CoA ligase [Bryobacteraceae bacterium]